MPPPRALRATEANLSHSIYFVTYFCRPSALHAAAPRKSAAPDEMWAMVKIGEGAGIYIRGGMYSVYRSANLG